MRIEKQFAAISIPILLAMPTALAAQPGYPEKPIRLVLGSAAGSGGSSSMRGPA